MYFVLLSLIVLDSHPGWHYPKGADTEKDSVRPETAGKY